MWSMKVWMSRTEVPKLGLKPRAPGERPWPRASQAKKSKSGRSQLVDQVRHAPRMLVAAMEHHEHRAVARRAVAGQWR
jgi:hypothetical protein